MFVPGVAFRSVHTLGTCPIGKSARTLPKDGCKSSLFLLFCLLLALSFLHARHHNATKRRHFRLLRGASLLSLATTTTPPPPFDLTAAGRSLWRMCVAVTEASSIFLCQRRYRGRRQQTASAVHVVRAGCYREYVMYRSQKIILLCIQDVQAATARRCPRFMHVRRRQGQLYNRVPVLFSHA